MLEYGKYIPQHEKLNVNHFIELFKKLRSKEKF